MDRAHEDVCGPAVMHLLKRAHRLYDDPRYERLAGLSVSHLYNLRKSADYQARRVSLRQDPSGVQAHWRAQGIQAQWTSRLGPH